MSDGVEASGPTVEEAIERALAEMGAREDEVEIEILSEGGSRGILGRKTGRASVRVRLRDERTPEEKAQAEVEGLPPGEEDGDDELLEDQADCAEDFLNGLLDVLDMDGEARADFDGPAIRVEMTGPEMGLLIGRHGATLEAIQELVRAAVQHETESRALLSLDIDGYRARQRAILERRVRGLAAQVRRDGKAIALEPMTAYERKVVHSALTDFQGVTTTSEGEEPDRKIVIHPA